MARVHWVQWAHRRSARCHQTGRAPPLSPTTPTPGPAGTRPRPQAAAGEASSRCAPALPGCGARFPGAAVDPVQGAGAAGSSRKGHRAPAPLWGVRDGVGAWPWAAPLVTSPLGGGSSERASVAGWVIAEAPCHVTAHYRNRLCTGIPRALGDGKTHCTTHFGLPKHAHLRKLWRMTTGRSSCTAS